MVKAYSRLVIVECTWLRTHPGQLLLPQNQIKWHSFLVQVQSSSVFCIENILYFMLHINFNWYLVARSQSLCLTAIFCLIDDPYCIPLTPSVKKASPVMQWSVDKQISHSLRVQFGAKIRFIIPFDTLKTMPDSWKYVTTPQASCKK